MKHLLIITTCLFLISSSLAQGKLGKFIKEAQEMEQTAEATSIQNQAYQDSLLDVRPGYEAKSNLYYDHSKAELPLNGYYIDNAGQKHDAIIAYLRPQFLMGLSTALFICNKTDGNKVNYLNSHLDANYKESVKYDDIRAFFISDQLYVKTSEGYITNLVTEGAIHTSTMIKLVDQKAQRFEVFPVTQKLNGPRFGSVAGGIKEAELLVLMSDAPEIVAGYKNGEYPLNEAEIRYNLWFDAKNPGKIKYFFAKEEAAAREAAAAKEATATATAAYEKRMMEAASAAHRAPKQNVFAGRPTTASTEIASAKPEVTVKKESFVERLNRIKADGNRVGVLVTCNNLVINPSDFSEGITKAQVMGSYGPLSGLDNLAKVTTDRLNTGFSSDIFEAVDYSLIPVKEGKYGKMDDWWSTKYKIIVLYELSPSYIAYYKTINTETGERQYNAQMKVDTEMIVMSAEDEKPEKLKYVTNSPTSWGYYRSEYYKAPAETDYTLIQDLKAAINPPSDELVIEEILKSQKEYLDKFVKKKSK